jgi:serine/threonine protein kinase
VAFACERVAESPCAGSASCSSSSVAAPAARKSARPSSCRAAYNCNVGTDGYRAPEARTAAAFTVAADTYSVGVVLLELLSGQPPMSAHGGSFLADRVHATLKVRQTLLSLPVW